MYTSSLISPFTKALLTSSFLIEHPQERAKVITTLIVVGLTIGEKVSVKSKPGL